MRDEGAGPPLRQREGGHPHPGVVAPRRGLYGGGNVPRTPPQPTRRGGREPGAEGVITTSDNRSYVCFVLGLASTRNPAWLRAPAPGAYRDPCVFLSHGRRRGGRPRDRPPGGVGGFCPAAAAAGTLDHWTPPTPHEEARPRGRGRASRGVSQHTLPTPQTVVLVPAGAAVRVGLAARRHSLLTLGTPRTQLGSRLSAIRRSWLDWSWVQAQIQLGSWLGREIRGQLGFF